MPHARASSSANCAKMQTKLSAWTPLNHPVANTKVFEERRTLLAKWFDRWSDRQRRAVLQDLVLSCSVEQLRFLSVSVSGRLPLQAADFTCLLPRALCLYLFSFLDPRSLCRCAQVSWHWKSIVELDQLWMPKCLRLGWCISFSPTLLEEAVWKRHYIQTVQELRLGPRQTVSSLQHFVTPDVTVISSRCDDLLEPAVLTEDEERPVSTVQQAGDSLRAGFMRDKQPTVLPPWRDADRHPKDTRRFNYLDNLDPIQQHALRGCSPGCRSTCSPALSCFCRKASSTAATSCSAAPTPDNGGQKSLSEANYKLRKAKSLMFLSSNCRPQHPPLHHHHDHRHDYRHTQSQTQWASHSSDYPVTKETAKSLLCLAQWNAGVRPGPVRAAVPRLSLEALKASQRSQRSAPSKPLFGEQPWIVSAPQPR